MTWTVYILRCADGSLYCGIARDVSQRIAVHNAGRGAKYTRARLPVALAWARRRQSETRARRLEYAIKQLERDDKLRLVDGSAAVWRALVESIRPRAKKRVRSRR